MQTLMGGVSKRSTLPLAFLKLYITDWAWSHPGTPGRETILPARMDTLPSTNVQPSSSPLTGDVFIRQ